uniref:ATP synthase F0 subunit 8 n=1 Tax=Psenopsis anomala TaxID=163124 RepID=R9RGP7_PSEAK|nr:ATP synthase F0 subunit 8 [Psenopsis anomala]AGM48308.1 ATP synthase F0 subunit 8 [Psenopsis anomala]BAX03868.1 ATPase subunit 8 [Psenopsis anomala]BBU26193.1 ATPase subunit 8 [Psenopsis anomala]
MPQTMPTPWFYSFLCTWCMFLAIVVPLLMAQKFPNKFPVKLEKKTNLKPGDSEWSWH